MQSNWQIILWFLCSVLSGISTCGYFTGQDLRFLYRNGIVFKTIPWTLGKPFHYTTGGIPSLFPTYNHTFNPKIFQRYFLNLPVESIVWEVHSGYWNFII